MATFLTKIRHPEFLKSEYIVFIISYKLHPERIQLFFMFSFFQSEPYAMLKKSTDSLEGNDKYEGFIVDLANKIASIVGFNFTIVPTKSHGSMNNNGQWNGMIKELLEEVNIKIYEFGKFMNLHNISIF